MMIGKLEFIYYFLVSFLLHLQVTIAQEPTLTLMPEIIRKNLGEAVFVSCTASVPNQDLVTNLEWKGPNDLVIPTEDESVTTLDGLGSANQLDLFIKKLRMEDVGNYTCHAIYAGNQRLTKTIKVEYYRDIDFKDTEKLQTPVLNSDAKIRCVVTSDPAPLVDWLKNGVPIKTSNRIIQQNDGILIKGITEDDEGVYKCRARVQALGEIKFIDIQVEVHIPPEITGAPKDTSGVEKESVAFICIATGKPAPTYTWVNKDSEVLNNKEGYYVEELTGELRILDLRPDHAGKYRCTAKNAAGEAFAEANLRVLMKPKIEQYLNVTVAEGEEAEMRCVMSGDPLPHAIFQKETNHESFITGVNEDERIEVRQELNDRGERVGVLSISDLTRRDDGLYTCTGNSTGGVAVAWGHITVEFKPSFEDQTQDEFWSWEQKPVNLTCLATSIPNATILWYIREQPIREDDPNLEVLSRGPNGVLKVHPVDGSYFDTYTCQATNTLGVTDHDVVLRQVQKPGPVSSTQVEKKTATTISWAIREPLNNGGLPVLGFTVEYRLADTSWEKSEQHFWPKGSSYVVDHLTPLAKYVFRFAARNDVGDGEWSGEKSVDMPKRSAPEEPLIYSIDPTGVKKIPYIDRYELQWQVPLDNGEPITYFQIVYFRVTEATQGAKPVGKATNHDVVYPGPSTYKIEGLHSNTLYKIELRAHNKIGFSTPAEAFIQTAYAPAVAEPDTEQENTHVGIIAAIVIIVFLIVLVIVDVILFFAKNVGLTALIVTKLGLKQSEKDKEAMIEEGSKSGKPDDNSNKEVDKVAVLKESSTVKEKECNETTPMITGLCRRSPFNSSIRRNRQETKSLFDIFAYDGSDEEIENSTNNDRFYCNSVMNGPRLNPFPVVNFNVAKEQLSKSSPNFFGGVVDFSSEESDLEIPPKPKPKRFAPVVPPRKPTQSFRPDFLKDVYYYTNDGVKPVLKKEETAFLIAPYNRLDNLTQVETNKIPIPTDIDIDDDHMKTAFKIVPYSNSIRPVKDISDAIIRPLKSPTVNPGHLVPKQETSPSTPAEYRRPPPISRSNKPKEYKNASPYVRSKPYEPQVLQYTCKDAFHITPYHRTSTFIDHNGWRDENSSSDDSFISRENLPLGFDENYQRNYLNNSIRILRHSVSNLDNVSSTNKDRNDTLNACSKYISNAYSLGNLLHDSSTNSRSYKQPTFI